MPKATESAYPIHLRITVVEPPPGIEWALQLGRDQLVAPTVRNAHGLTFDFNVDVVDEGPTGKFRLRGPAVQGKPGERFVYVAYGTYAGQAGAAGGRAKVRLEGITRKLIDTISKKGSGVLHVEFAGTGRNGGPAGATVPLLGDGWIYLNA